MEFTVQELGPGISRIVLTGRLDAVGAESIDAPLAAALAGIKANVMLDLTAVPFVGSLGIRVLVSAARTMQRQGQKLAFFGLAPAVAEAFEMVSLDDLVPIAADEAAARRIVGA